MQPYRQLNAPIYRASTVLFDDFDGMLKRMDQLYDGYVYGGFGTPTTRELEEKIASIEGGTQSLVVPSGLAALTHTLLTFCNSGEHVLVADCAYPWLKVFCKTRLSKFGIDVEYFPSSADSIASRLRPETRVVVLESPGSYTMEIQEIDTITAEAHEAGALVVMDNSWGFGISNMFRHGIDISCVALSKYASGSGDLVLGSITVKNDVLYKSLKDFAACIGAAVSSEDVYLVLRSLPSLQVRMSEHARRAERISAILASRPEVDEVFNPALPTSPYHARFKRYFRSSNGLITVRFKNNSLSNVRRMIDGFSVFGIGLSWGSTHSLLSFSRSSASRDVDKMPEGDYLVRFHIGLEDFEKILDDLNRGIDRLSLDHDEHR